MTTTTALTRTKTKATRPRTQKPTPKTTAKPTSKPRITSKPSHPPSEDMQPQLALIASSTRTPFEKRVWSALCQIPRGQVSTYALLSAHLNSSPRAVGGALRRNPFAPGVPCHRIVATGGGLGGFKGEIARRNEGEGITLVEKRGLLKSEGIRFDEKGRVLGSPWMGFV